jgi:hypothetical protein
VPQSAAGKSGGRHFFTFDVAEAFTHLVGALQSASAVHEASHPAAVSEGSADAVMVQSEHVPQLQSY